MYVRVSSRKNKTGQVVRYLQLAHNEWDPVAGVSRTKVLHSFGREDEIDRSAIERLVAALTKLLDPAGAVTVAGPVDMTFTESRPMGGHDHRHDPTPGPIPQNRPTTGRPQHQLTSLFNGH